MTDFDRQHLSVKRQPDFRGGAALHAYPQGPEIPRRRLDLLFTQRLEPIALEFLAGRHIQRKAIGQFGNQRQLIMKRNDILRPVGQFLTTRIATE